MVGHPLCKMIRFLHIPTREGRCFPRHNLQLGGQVWRNYIGEVGGGWQRGTGNGELERAPLQPIRNGAAAYLVSSLPITRLEKKRGVLETLNVAK